MGYSAPRDGKRRGNMREKRLAFTSSGTANELPAPGINNAIIISILAVISYVLLTSLISAKAITGVYISIYCVITSEAG
jgi:hypothetical protein